MAFAGWRGGDMGGDGPGSDAFLPPGLRARLGGDNPFGGGSAPAAPVANPFAALMPTPDQIGGFAPASYGQFGGVPTIDPSFMNAAMVDPSQLPGALQQYQALLYQQMDPQFAQQRQDLDADMAARGIFSSGVGTQASNDLSSQQAAAIAQPLGNLVQQFAGFQQQDALQNAENQQQANQFNAGAANTAGAANAAAYGNIVSNDQSQYNAFLQQLMQYGMGLDNGLMGSYLGTYGVQPGALGILSQGLSNAGSAYDNALAAGSGNASNFANIFGNAASAFGGMLTHSPSTPMPSYNPSGTGGQVQIGVNGQGAGSINVPSGWGWQP